MVCALVVLLGACSGDALPALPDVAMDRDLSIEFGDPPDAATPPEPPDLALPRDRDAACVQVRAEAAVRRNPVDIIFLVDNSASMADKILGLELSINTSFGDILTRSGLDYRVIMLSHYGPSAQQGVCVPPPLGKQTMGCNPPDAQVENNPPRFYHYNWDIQSWDSFRKAIAQYDLPDLDGKPTPQGNCNGVRCGGWNAYLRKEASKVFIEVTDDKSDLTSGQIDAFLLALDPQQFGTAKRRNYLLHSIIGLTANNPPTKPWGPKDPIQPGKCGASAYTNGQEYQELSIVTGGLRLPICEWANFGSMLVALTKDLLSVSRLACTLPSPMPPLG